jgi:hypothetical protein
MKRLAGALLVGSVLFAGCGAATRAQTKSTTASTEPPLCKQAVIYCPPGFGPPVTAFDPANHIPVTGISTTVPTGPIPPSPETPPPTSPNSTP